MMKAKQTIPATAISTLSLADYNLVSVNYLLRILLLLILRQAL
jgi:hypothetical protein